MKKKKIKKKIKKMKKIKGKIKKEEKKEEETQKKIVGKTSRRQALAILLLAITIFALFTILFIYLSAVTSNIQQASIVDKVNESEDFQKQIYTRPTTLVKVIYNRKE